MTYLRRQRHELQLTAGCTQRQAAKRSARAWLILRTQRGDAQHPLVGFEWCMEPHGMVERRHQLRKMLQK